MPVQEDGTLRAYNDTELDDMDLRQRGARDGSHPTERYAPDGSGCTRKWFAKWESRLDAVKHLMGQAETYVSGADTLITRLLPQTHPEQTKWICTKAEVTGFAFLKEFDETAGRGNRMPKYKYAEITAQYEQASFDLKTDLQIDYTDEILRYVTKPGYPETPPQPQTEYLTFPGGVQRFLVDGGGGPHGIKIPYNTGMPLVGERLQAVWRRVPAEEIFNGSGVWFTRIYGDPLAGTLPWEGSLNSTTLFGRKPLTMLLESVEPNRRPDPTAASGYSADIRFTWIFKPQTHVRLFFFDTKETPTITNGWYVYGKGPAYSDPTTWTTADSGQFYCRDHAAGLFSLNAV